MQSQMFLENYTFPGWRHDLQDLVRRLEEQFHHVDETFQGALIYILITMIMIILDWNDDFDDYSDQRRAWPTAVGVPPRSPSSSRPGPMDLLRLGGNMKVSGEVFFFKLRGEQKSKNITEDGIFFAQIFSSDLGLPTQPEAPNPYNQGTWEMILTKSLRLGEPDFFLLHCLKGHSYEYKDFLLGCRPSSQLHESGRDRNSDMRWCCRRVALRKLFWKSQSLFWSWLSSFPQVGVSDPVGQQLGQLQQTRPDERKWYVRQAMLPNIWLFYQFQLGLLKVLILTESEQF